MMHWRDIALTILGFLHLTDRPTEEELIEHGRELEREKQRKGYVHIYIDPTVRSYPQQSAPVTDPAHLGIRKRAMTRQLTENHTFMQHHNEMLKKKAQAGEQDTETKILPTIQQPRKLHFQRLYAEPDSPFNAL